MKAIAYFENLPADHPEALRIIAARARAGRARPAGRGARHLREPRGREDPRQPQARDGQPEVIGWDAAGVVRAVGSRVSLFKPGDRVWYAGALDRPGANSELHAVDERIVGRMPDSLDFAQAAALPLTTITAWELLFDRLRVLDNALPSQQSLLVVARPAAWVPSWSSWRAS